MQAKQVVAGQMDILDISKFIFSLMIVMLHVNPFGGGYGDIVLPYVRIAVPMFFMIGSYLFFKRLEGIEENRRWDLLKKYLLRIGKLYAVWFVILLPYTVVLRDYYVWDGGRVTGKFLAQLVLGSTFPVSWYLSATITGTFIVFALSRRIGDRMLLLTGIILYVICCLMSNYGNLFPDHSGLIRLRELYPTDFYCSFPVSILWIALGKMFADRTHGTGITNMRKAQSIRALLVSMAMLVIEQRMIKDRGWSFTNDCYFWLIPACFFLFQVLISTNISIQKAGMLRCISTITYVTHLTVGTILRHVLRGMGVEVDAVPQATLLFLGVTGACWLFSYVVYKLEMRWKWLRTLH